MINMGEIGHGVEVVNYVCVFVSVWPFLHFFVTNCNIKVQQDPMLAVSFGKHHAIQKLTLFGEE